VSLIFISHYELAQKCSDGNVSEEDGKCKIILKGDKIRRKCKTKWKLLFSWLLIKI